MERFWGVSRQISQEFMINFVYFVDPLVQEFIVER